MRREKMTVGFADLTNFASLMNTVGEEGALASLQACLDAAGDAITRRGGRLRKYIGDAILFTFADPAQATAAAKELAGFRHAAGGVELRYYASLATGDVLVADLGHASYRIEDILGQTVNRAALLLRQARQEPDGVAMDEATRNGAS